MDERSSHLERAPSTSSDTSGQLSAPSTPLGSLERRKRKKGPPGIQLNRTDSEYLVNRIVERDHLRLLSDIIGPGQDAFRRDSECEKVRNIQHGDGRRVELVEQKIGRITHVEKMRSADQKHDTLMIRKVLQMPSGANYAENCASIHNELKILVDVKSEFIVKYYGAFVDAATQEVHIFMEYLDGGSFASMLPRVGRFPEEILIHVAKQSASGLLYLLEEHNAIHRDIKPGNILCNTRGCVKICDFGTSRIIEKEAKAITFIGTMVYMSPERVEGKVHDSSGDVWSLGLSMLEMATGLRQIPTPTNKNAAKLAASRVDGKPFEMKKPVPIEGIAFAIINEIALGPPLRLPEEGNFSDAFEEVIARTLDRDPATRMSLRGLLNSRWIRESRVTAARCAVYFRWALSDPVVPTTSRSAVNNIAMKLSTQHI